MPRLLFEKKGNAVWISHLDLMRLFQRAFKRAGLPLKHTQGFNPRPSVSIALPLSVGVESVCELLDFEVTEEVSCEDIRDRLNDVLVDGIRVLNVFENGRKIRELSLLHCIVTMEYDNGIPENAVDTISELFGRSCVTAPKKTKSGIQEQDLIPMIRRIAVSQKDHNTIELDALVCCQNPTLNPAQLALAVGIHLPELKPDFSSSRRLEIYDEKETVFR